MKKKSKLISIVLLMLFVSTILPMNTEANYNPEINNIFDINYPLDYERNSSSGWVNRIINELESIYPVSNLIYDEKIDDAIEEFALAEEQGSGRFSDGSEGFVVLLGLVTLEEFKDEEEPLILVSILTREDDDRLSRQLMFIIPEYLATKDGFMYNLASILDNRVPVDFFDFSDELNLSSPIEIPNTHIVLREGGEEVGTYKYGLGTSAEDILANYPDTPDLYFTDIDAAANKIYKSVLDYQWSDDQLLMLDEVMGSYEVKNGDFSQTNFHRIYPQSPDELSITTEWIDEFKGKEAQGIIYNIESTDDSPIYMTLDPTMAYEKDVFYITAIYTADSRHGNAYFGYKPVYVFGYYPNKQPTVLKDANLSSLEPWYFEIGPSVLQNEFSRLAQEKFDSSTATDTLYPQDFSENYDELTKLEEVLLNKMNLN